MSKTNEITNNLTQAIIKMLSLYGYLAWRNNNAPIYDIRRKVYRSNNTLKGIADVLGLSPAGRFIAVEVKTGKDRQSKEQKEFQNDVIRRGGIYIVAHTVDDIMHLIEK